MGLAKVIKNVWQRLQRAGRDFISPPRWHRDHITHITRNDGMSLEQSELETIEAIKADFESFLEVQNWEEAEETIFFMGSYDSKEAENMQNLLETMKKRTTNDEGLHEITI